MRRGTTLGGVRVRLRVLGPLEVEGPNGVVRLGGPKERCVLAALAVSVGEVVGEAALVDALWGDSPPRTAGKTLQNYVLRLRRALRGCPDIRIVTRPPGYLLEAPTDAAEAADLLARDRHDDALALWRGAAYAEFADRPFARAEAARLDELRERAQEDRVAALLDRGGHREAVGVCERLVALQPLRERRWELLMTALYRDGRQGEALTAAHRLRARLTDELGIDPGPGVRALEQAILRQEPVPAAPARTPGFVGRARELERLLPRIHAAVAGRGGVVFLRGEPGIGKSRLLAELGAAAQRVGAEILVGRCLEGADPHPYAPFAAALGTALFAGQPTGLRPDERRLRLLDAVAHDLADRAAAHPVLVLLDDLHWADDGTVDMLRHTARVTVGRRLLVVGAYRGGEIDDDHPLAEALGGIGSEVDTRTLPLAGLDRAAVGELVAATVGAAVADGLVAAIREETGGNPFLVRELARHLDEEGLLEPGPDGLRAALPLTAVPDGARHVLARRRRRLPAEVNRLLDTAAGMEGPFPFAVVARVAGLSDGQALAALDAALSAGLVIPDQAADRYEFTHALIRHAAYGELNPSRRLRLHRALAEALSEARAAGVAIGPAEVAVQYHRSRALPGAEAGVPAAREAAARSAALGSPDEEVLHLRMARDLIARADPELLGALALAEAWSLRFDAAVRTAEAAVRAGARDDTLAEVATALAGAGSTEHAWRVAQLRPPRPEGDGTAWATLTLLTLDRREATDPDHPGMQLDLPGRRRALTLLYESGRLAGRGDLGRYAIAAIHGRRDRVPAAAGHDPTVAAYLLGDYAAAVPLFAAQAEEAETRGRLALAIYCRAGQARCQIALGDLDAGRATLAVVRGLVARAPELPLGWQLLHHQGAEDALVMARDEGWERRVAEFEPWTRPGPGQHWGTAAIAGIAARNHAHLGRVGRAMGLLARPVRALRQAPAWAPNFARTACEVAETLWLLDRRDHLAVVESALREKALPSDFRFPMTDARQALARLCALDGRPGEAARWFDRARTVLTEQGSLPMLAIVDRDEERMRRRGVGTGRGATSALRTRFERAE